jgi:mannose-6-phosphate isomerase-like protein (cupin superfamily)
MNSNTTILLVAAAFTMLGFILGRVTGPKLPMAAGHFEVLKHMSEGDMTALGVSGEVQVIVQSLEEGDFEGDTVFAIPGGQMHMVKNGEDIEVEVTETSVNEWVEKDDDGVITKRIIVTTED